MLPRRPNCFRLPLARPGNRLRFALIALAVAFLQNSQFQLFQVAGESVADQRRAVPLCPARSAIGSLRQVFARKHHQHSLYNSALSRSRHAPVR